MFVREWIFEGALQENCFEHNVEFLCFFFGFTYKQLTGHKCSIEHVHNTFLVHGYNSKFYITTKCSSQFANFHYSAIIIILKLGFAFQHIKAE